MSDDLAAKIAAAISRIPVQDPGITFTFSKQTLSDKLSWNLIDHISTVAAECSRVHLNASKERQINETSSKRD